LHQVMLYKECGRDPAIFNLTEEMYSRLEEVAGGVDTARLIRFLDILTDVERQLTFSEQPRIILELGLIKMTARTEENQLAELENRLRELEEKVEQLSRGNLSLAAASRPVAGGTTTGRSSTISKETAHIEEDTSAYKPEVPGDSGAQQEAGEEAALAYGVEDIRDKYWKEILKRIRENDFKVYALLADAVPFSIEGNRLYIQVLAQFHKNNAEKQADFIKRII